MKRQSKSTRESEPDAPAGEEPTAEGPKRKRSRGVTITTSNAYKNSLVANGVHGGQLEEVPNYPERVQCTKCRKKAWPVIGAKDVNSHIRNCQGKDKAIPGQRTKKFMGSVHPGIEGNCELAGSSAGEGDQTTMTPTPGDETAMPPTPDAGDSEASPPPRHFRWRRQGKGSPRRPHKLMASTSTAPLVVSWEQADALNLLCTAITSSAFTEAQLLGELFGFREEVSHLRTELAQARWENNRSARAALLACVLAGEWHTGPEHFSGEPPRCTMTVYWRLTRTNFRFFVGQYGGPSYVKRYSNKTVASTCMMEPDALELMRLVLRDKVDPRERSAEHLMGRGFVPTAAIRVDDVEYKYTLLKRDLDFEEPVAVCGFYLHGGSSVS